MTGRTALVLGSASLALLSPSAAWAQPVTPEQDSDSVDEIIVTAQRRAEALEDVPAAVTVVQGETLENAGVVNFHNLGNVVPGAQINFAGGFTQPAIRGVSTLTNGNFVENNVAVYVDGFYEPQPLLLNADLPNISSIEVLKGPQGTLYGRNATGGAILVNTLAPSDVLTGQAEITYGRFDDKRASAYVSGPLADSIRIGVGAYYRQTDSYLRLVSPTVVDETIGPAAPIRQAAIRAKLEIDLTDDLTATLGYNYVHINDPRTLIFTPRAHIAPAVAAPPLRATGDRRASYNFDTTAPNSQHQGTLKLEWNTGPGTLTSYTGYAYSRQKSAFDNDGTYAHTLTFQTNFKQETFQQAIDYAIDALDGVDLIVGGMYYYDTLGNPSGEFGTAILAGPDRTPLFFGFSRQRTEAWAIYADATWQATGALSINVGARYSDDSKENFAVNRLPDGTIINFGPWQAEDSWSKFTPRATIRYELAPRTNIYASWSKGFRGGTFPSDPPNTATDVWTSIEPETITAYEVGFKTARANLQFDAAAFYYDYRNLHVATNVLSSACQNLPAGSPPCNLIVTVFQNAPKAEIYGMDAQISATPIENLNLRAGVSLLHARYKELTNITGTGLNPVTNTNVSQQQDWSGQQMARAPDWSGNVGFDYNIPMGDGGLLIAGNASFTDSYVVNNASLFGPLAGARANKQRYRQDSYVLLSANITWTEPSGHFYIGVFGRNLTNTKHRLSNTGNTSGDYYTIAEPLTYGVKTGFNF